MDRTGPRLETGELELEPLTPQGLHEVVQARLLQFIRNRQLRAGDRLPSQAVLAEGLGISQAALREAMRALEALGIIEARVGSGWYVRDFTFDAVARGLAYTFELNRHSFADLLEIRIRLESSYLLEVIPQLAADDLDALERYVSEMESLAASGEEFDAPDRAFHMALFSGRVKNRLFTEVLELFWTLYPLLSTPPERRNRKVLLADAATHRQMLEAIRAGDVELAARRLLDSLQGAVRRASEADRAA